MPKPMHGGENVHLPPYQDRRYFSARPNAHMQKMNLKAGRSASRCICTTGLTRIIDGAILVEYSLGIFLLPAPVLLLPTYDEVHGTLDDVFLGVLAVDESEDRPGGHHDLRFVVLSVLEGHAGLPAQRCLVCASCLTLSSFKSDD